MLQPEEVVKHFQSLYGFNIVKIDGLTQFQRDVTLITIEVPNELLEQALTMKKRIDALPDGTHIVKFDKEV
jgi:hypothetical protein